MTEKYLDGRIRPVYESMASATALGGAVASAFWGQAIGLPAPLALGTSLTMTAMAVWRENQAQKVKRYQYEISKLRPFFVTPGQLPKSKGKLWIGRGFEFLPIHAQRIYESRSQYAEDLLKPSNLTNWLRENERLAGIDNCNFLRRFIAKNSKKSHILGVENIFSPAPPVGGDGRFHAVGLEDERDIYLDLGSRNGHLCCIGTTRAGKSRLIEVLVSQDISRNDGAVVVVDPKGDSSLLSRTYIEAVRAGREKDFFVLHLGFPEASCRYNAIGNFSKIVEVAGRISSQMETSGDAVFADFAWRFMSVVATAYLRLGIKTNFSNMKQGIEDPEIVYKKYAKYFFEKHLENWEEVYQKTRFNPTKYARSGGEIPAPKHLQGRDKDTVTFDQMYSDFFDENPHVMDMCVDGLRSTMRNEVSYYGKITASLLPLLTKLTSGKVAELIVPDYEDAKDDRPIIDWNMIIRRNAIVYVALDGMTDSTVSSAVGRMLAADLLSVSGDIYQHGVEKGQNEAKRDSTNNVWMHVDEFSTVSSEPWVGLLNRSAGSGVRISCYSQTRADLEMALGNKSMARVIEGNFNTLIMLRVKSRDTAEWLTDQVPKCDRYGLDVTGGISDTDLTKDSSAAFGTKKSVGVGVAKSDPIISPEDIINLPVGQAFALIEGARLVKLRFPLYSSNDDDLLPPTLEELKTRMEAKYQEQKQWWNDGGAELAQEDFDQVI